MNAVLIAVSDQHTAGKLAAALAAREAVPVQALDGASALDLLEQRSFKAVLAERDLPKVSGFELLKHVQVRHPKARVVLVSADGTSKAALQAVRAGAADYLPCPLDPQELNDCLDRILLDESSRSGEEEPRKPRARFDHIIGQSQAIREVFRLVEKVADTDSTVMIYGESGTGKELIARAIHQNSRRRKNPLIPVNCGAIPEELLESELFGHEKGSFTSAIRTRIGRFELADGGTIFLDEIADMSPKLQVKILRVLQEHQFERIGGTKTLGVNIRVITATNKNLRQAMEAGRFREDLFYRLNVIPVTVPPLRERQADIPILVEHFLARFRETKEKNLEGITPEAMAKLMNYSWPGNIRELENIIERMVILADEPILTVKDLPSRFAGAEPPAKTRTIEFDPQGIDFNQAVSDFENDLLLQALEKSGWVKNKAAKMLNINRTTLVEKLKKKNIFPPRT